MLPGTTHTQVEGDVSPNLFLNKYCALSNPLADILITTLRDQTTKRAEFHGAFERLAILLFAEAATGFETKVVDVTTPLETTTGRILAQGIVFVPILRAGLAMLQGLEAFYPDASVGCIGMKRDEETAEADCYLINLPALTDQIIVVLDPMVATGGSASRAITAIKRAASGRQAKIVLLCAFAAPCGVRRILTDHPDVRMYIGAVDRTLNVDAYILPGCGDAGNRALGT